MKKLVSVLLTLAVALSLGLLPVVASADLEAPIIDGVISAGEWDGATNYALVPSNLDCSRSYTAYVTNDAKFLYVAFDYDIAIGSDFLSVGVYKEGAFEPEQVNAPGINAYTGVVPEVHAMWDMVLDSDGNGVFWEGGGDYSRIEPAEDYSSDLEWAVSTATEMAVPLADLGIAVGDTIKLSLGINEHPWTADEPPVPIEDACWHGYPEGADPHDPLGTFADFTLEANTAVDIVAETPMITAINVDPTSIDFGTVKPGDVVSGPNVTVANIGTVKVSVDASLDPLTGTVFNYLKLKGAYSPGYSGLWDNIISGMLPSVNQTLTTALDVPSTYSAQGIEAATLIFTATAV